MSTGEQKVSHAVRVVVVGLASCFGCQVQITNIEAHLLSLLGQIDLQYWQLASSSPMPTDFDVAVVEGAITTEESLSTVRALRKRAQVLIAIGACATTGGIPGMAGERLDECAHAVYGDAGVPQTGGGICAPRPLSAVVPVDFEVRCCPIDPMKFVAALHQALYGSNASTTTATLCGECKRNDHGCFFDRGILCLGLVTRAGCGARCTNLSRPCNGCAGLSPDANLVSARDAVERYGISVSAFNDALCMFNAANPDLSGE